MKKYSLAAILGGAILSVVPASANTTPFNFVLNKDASNSNLSAISGGGYTTTVAVTTGSVTTNVTLNMYAFDVSAAGTPSGTSTFASATTGLYGTNGLGICETGAASPDCTSPNHQVNNGNDGIGTNNHYEFMLFQFVGATVNLSSMTLGNFGNNGGTADPFNGTYWTYSGSSTSIQSALAGTTLSNLTATSGTGALGFSAAGAADCTVSGASTCGLNTSGDVDNLTGSNVSYLLFGASTASLQAGTDFFKLQGLNLGGYTANLSSPTPEPATFGLIGLALAGLGIYGRKRKS